MDRNTIIGFVLLGILFLGYFFYSSQEQKAVLAHNKHIEDSINRLKPKVDTSLQTANLRDSVAKKDSVPAGIQQDSLAKEQLITLENKVVKITFTNKGGQPKQVELKNFKTHDGKPLLIDDGTFNEISYAINTGDNQTSQTGDLLFTPSQVQKSADGNQIISFSLRTQAGEKIEHEYVLRPDDYMIDFMIKMNGANKLVTQNTINLLWKGKADQMEKDMSWETQQSHISFVENGEYDFEHIVEKKADSKTFSKPVDWVAINQQFFATTIIAKNKFTSGEIKWKSPEDTSLHIIGEATANLKLAVPAGTDALIPLQLYYGPNDYKILKSYDNQMFNMVALGSGIFAFVKYVNRGFIMPVFNFLSSRIASLGLVIALMTILIRLLISPLSYQSYLSGAKMKVLKPEIDELKAKFKDDKQAFGMEQMKLFKS
ncbi:MAG: membrane protein insertase YidC, partial [Ginsengibacter sp.]